MLDGSRLGDLWNRRLFGTDQLTAVPPVNRSVDSDVVRSRTNPTQIDFFFCGHQRYTGNKKKAFRKSAKLKFSGIKIWIIFIKLLKKINFSQIILVDKIYVQV